MMGHGHGEGLHQGPSLQPVAAERVFHSRIGQQRTGVTQHVEPFQAQRFHAQVLLQPQPQPQPSGWPLKAGHSGQGRRNLLGETWGGLPCVGRRDG